MIKPSALLPGDTIGLVSPSSPVAGLVPHRFKNAVKRLEDLGYRVKIAPHALDVTKWTAGTAQDRANDLHAMFLDPEVKAVMSCIGGFHSNQVLPFLDFKLISSHPKIFIGFSDISVLHFALNTQAGLVTFYGPALMTQFGEPFGIDAYTLDSFGRILGEAKPYGPVPASKEWTDELLNWFQQKDLERPRQMKPNRGHVWLKHGVAEGELVGGCLTSILHLRGTTYWPNFEGKIFFWELPESSGDMSKGEALSRVDAHLTDLELNGISEGLAGMVIGRPKGYSDEDFDALSALVMSHFENFDFPILYNLDIGHTDPIMTLPLGIKARLDSDAGTFSLLESAVS